LLKPNQAHPNHDQSTLLSRDIANSIVGRTNVRTDVDLEYLRSRYRDSAQRATNATSAQAQLSHEGVAAFYARWILEEEARIASATAHGTTFS
jgi:hypothetical protein